VDQDVAEGDEFREKSGIRSAIAVSARASRARGLANDLELALDGGPQNISRSKSAKVLPVVMVAIASAASRASQQQAFRITLQTRAPATLRYRL